MTVSHRWPTAAAAVAVVLGLLPAGCSGPPPPPPLRVIDEAGFAEALRARRGKVVLVDFWATWCTSCIELFPHTAALEKKYADRGLAVISVSLDDPEEQAAARKVLARQSVAFPGFISRYGGGEKSFEIFVIEDGALPHMKLYDRRGKLCETFASGAGAIEPEEIGRAVEALLDAPDSS